jgi:hypothetical protein
MIILLFCCLMGNYVATKNLSSDIGMKRHSFRFVSFLLRVKIMAFYAEEPLRRIGILNTPLYK